MIVETKFPPNYELIKTAFPNCESHKAVFTYGNTIYNPFNAQVTPDIEKHEEVHSKQQGDNPDLWWNDYILSKEFRLKEEMEAYSKQYKFVLDTLGSSKLTDWLLDKISLAISGELYGLDISYGEARSKIRNYAKS